jgi:hypothetical protein
LGTNVDTAEGINRIKNDLKKLEEWSDKWQMDFNLEKCKVMHIGCKNTNANYQFLGRPLVCCSEETDLGIIISTDLKFNKHCIQAEKKAMRILGYIKWHFNYRDETIVLNLYKSLVRPHLEYAS